MSAAKMVKRLWVAECDGSKQFVTAADAAKLEKVIEAAGRMADAYRPPATIGIHTQRCDCALCVYQARRAAFDAARAAVGEKP